MLPLTQPLGKIEADVIIDDRYQLVSLIGKGAWCEVWYAVDVTLQQACAVKLVVDKTTAKSRKLWVAVLQREARVMVRVPRRARPEIYAAGLDKAYFAMELLPGKTLEEWCPPIGGTNPPAFWVAFMLESLIDSLRLVHEAKIAHRDVKPANVIVSETGTAKLIDFGLSMDEREKVNQQGVVGSRLFMAPETRAGHRMSLTDYQAADRYGLGRTLEVVLQRLDRASWPPGVQDLVEETVRAMPHARMSLKQLQDRAWEWLV